MKWFVATAIGVLLVSCTPKPYIPIHYQLDPPAESAQPHRIFIQFADERQDPMVLQPEAASKFQHFSGYFSLILSDGDQAEINLGSQSLPALFELALARRMQTDGVEVCPTEKTADAVLLFRLRHFHLGFSDNRWNARLSYSAELTRDGASRSTRTADASGEQLRTFGTRQAELLLGAVFSDAVNQLDVQSLVREVGLR